MTTLLSLLLLPQQATLLYDFLLSSCWVFFFSPGDFKEPPAVSLLLPSLLPPFYPSHPHPSLNTSGISRIQTNPSGNHQCWPLVTCCECYLCCRPGRAAFSQQGVFSAMFEGRGPQELFVSELPFCGVAVGSQT